MSLENVSSDENITPSLKSQSSQKIRRAPRKVNWTTAAPEKETYRTVVNYHCKLNKSRRNGTCAQKKRGSWSRMMVAIANKRCNTEEEDFDCEHDDDEDIPNLAGLYTLSEEKLAKATNVMLNDAESHKASSSDMNHNNKVEICSVSRSQPASLKQHCRSIAQMTIMGGTDIIVISDDEDDANNARLTEHTKNTQTSSANVCFADASSCCQIRTSQHSQRPTTSKGDTLPEVTSSDTSQKLQIKTQAHNTFKQRQLELHRHRIAVEVKRLELLEVKLARERDEMFREQILFERELELKNTQLKELILDRDDLK